MIKPILVLSVLILGSSTLLNSQKMKSEYVKFLEMNMPKNPLQGEFKTYNIRIEDSGLNVSQYGLDANYITGLLKNLEAYEYVDSRADFTVNVKLFQASFTDTYKDSYKKKEGSGDNAKEVTKYKWGGNVRLPINIILKDAAQNNMSDVQISSYENPKAIGKKGFANYKAMSDDYNKVHEKEIAKTVSGIIVDEIKAYAKKLKKDIDIYKVNSSVPIMTIKKAEKYKMEDFDKNLERTKAVLSGKMFDASMLNELSSTIDNWKGSLTQYSPANKKERDAFFSAAYNIAQLNILAGNLGVAKDMIAKMKETDSDKLKVSAVESLIKDKERLMKVNSSIENKFAGWSEGGQASPINVEVSNYVNDGYVLDNNDNKYEGKIKILYSTDDNLTGIKVMQSNVESTTLMTDDIKMAHKNGKDLYVMNPLGNRHILVYTVDNSDKLGLVETFTNDGPDGSYLFVNVKDKEYYIAQLILNPNKKFSKLFPECSAMVKKAENKAYKSNIESYKELINDMKLCDN